MGFRTNCLIKFKQNIFPKKPSTYKVCVEFSKEFLEIKENKITIGIKSKPTKGETNKEIIKKLSKHFKVSSSLVQIKSGHKSHAKIIENLVFCLNRVVKCEKVCQKITINIILISHFSK